MLGAPLVAGVALAAEPGKLSLVEAAKQGNRDVVRSLLGARADESLTGPEATEALIWAASRNDLEMADLLLGAGTDAKGANDYGATALYAAAGHADPAMTLKLLAAGADANARLASGETPLMVAARRGNLETLHALLSNRANPNAQEANGGQTALMWAISERHVAVVEELVRGGADVGVHSKRGSTALMFAAQQSNPGYARILLDAGANANDVMPRTGVTPLIIACAMGNADVAALLLDKRADPDAADVNSFTSLHHAAKDRGAVRIVKALLAHGAKPDVRLKQQKPSTTVNGVSLQGATPLLLAAEKNNFETIKVLVEAGADPLIATERNTSPLILAAGGGTDVVRPRGAKERATAIQTVRFLVEHGADVNGVGEFGWTPLHAASYQGLNDVIAFLVAKGAKLDAMDRLGQTPVSIASSVLTKDIGSEVLRIPRILRQDTVDLLLKLGATPLDRSGVAVVLQRNNGG
jgi:ankyrin repeat protein